MQEEIGNNHSQSNDLPVRILNAISRIHHQASDEALATVYTNDQGRPFVTFTFHMEGIATQPVEKIISLDSDPQEMDFVEDAIDLFESTYQIRAEHNQQWKQAMDAYEKYQQMPPDLRDLFKKLHSFSTT